jgi:hypothetical protein
MSKDPLQLLLEHLRTEEGAPIPTSSLGGCAGRQSLERESDSVRSPGGCAAGTSTSVRFHRRHSPGLSSRLAS